MLLLYMLMIVVWMDTLHRHKLQTTALCVLRTLKTSPVSASAAITTPPLDGAPKQYSPKIQQLVSDIANLTLIEVSDLNELLKVCVCEHCLMQEIKDSRNLVSH